jgi:hypothetical protein
MRTVLMATAASAAFLLASAAQAQVVGHVGANYTRADVDFGAFDADADGFQIEGAAAFDLGGLGAQVDGAVSDAEGADTVWTVTGHLNQKFGETARAGGFAGVTVTDGYELWGLGLEGQADVAPSTVLYGQVGYGEANDLDLEIWAARGEIRQYVGDNIRLTGSVGYLNGKIKNVGDADAWSIGAEGEYQFSGTPFSVYGGYQRTDSNDLGVEVDTFRVGARFTFGGATLRTRDSAGASLGGVNKLLGGLTN